MDRPALLDQDPWAAVLAAAAATPGACALHRAHTPRTLTLHHHHIFPLGMGGPDEPWNVLAVCPTGHVNVHLMLRALHTGAPLRGGHGERRIAALGLALWTAAGQPGGRVTLAHE